MALSEDLGMNSLPSKEQKTSSGTSLEEEIHLQTSLMMTMMISSRLVDLVVWVVEVKINKDRAEIVDNNNKMIPLVDLEGLVALEALVASEVSVEWTMMISLEEAALVAEVSVHFNKVSPQVDQDLRQSKPKLISKTAKESLKLRKL